MAGGAGWEIGSAASFHEGEDMSDNEQIKPIIDRLIQLENEKRRNAEDIKELMSEAKAIGYTPAAIKLNVKEMLKDEAKKQREREIREHAELYAQAYGQGDLFG